MNTQTQSTPKEAPTEKRPLGMKKLNPRHQELLRLLLRGDSLDSACKALGMNKNSAVVIKNFPLFKEEMARQQELLTKKVVENLAAISAKSAAEQYMEDHALSSAEKIVELRDESMEDRIKLQASQDILNRVGVGSKFTHGGSKNVGVGMKISVSMSDEKLSLIAQSAAQVRDMGE